MKSALIHLCLILAGAASAPALKAQENEVLGQYLRQAAENNPGVQASFNNYYAALEKVPQVGALPDPKILFGYYIPSMEIRMGERVFDLGLSQSFPWFGTLQAQKDEASRQAEMQYQVFLKEKNDLFYKVKSAYYKLYANQKSISITEEYLKILRKDERLALNRVEAGRASMSDVLRVQMEIKENQTRLEFFRDNKQSLASGFNALLNRPVDEQVAVTDSLGMPGLTMNDKSLMDSVLNKNPELNRLREQDAALESRIAVAKKSGMPSLDLGVSYANMSPLPEMEANRQVMLMPMATISIPLYRKKYKAMVNEAGLQRRSVQHEIADMQNTLQADLVSAINNYKDAERKVALYNELLIQARQTLNILTAAYMGGEEDYEEVLRVEQQLLRYQLDLENARADLNTSVALIEKLRAKDIE